MIEALQVRVLTLTSVPPPTNRKFGNRTVISSDVVLGHGPWSYSLVVLKDKLAVLGPGLGLEVRVLDNITGSCCFLILEQEYTDETRDSNNEVQSLFQI